MVGIQSWLVALVLATYVTIGTASWGDFSGHIVTRYQRGTHVHVCVTRCVVGRSWGYGPASWTHRIVDLDRRLFRRVCGDPSRGLCRVALWRI